MGRSSKSSLRARGWMWLACVLALVIAAGCESTRANTNASSWNFANGIAARGGSNLVEDGRGGMVARAWRDATKVQGTTFGARLPTFATGAIAVGLATHAETTSDAGDYVLRVTHDGLAEAPLVNEGGRATYRDVATSTDLLVKADDTAVEWFYALRDERAEAHFTMRVDLPRGLASAEARRDGSIAFVDARGKARLTMPKAHAIDAHGVAREVTLTWSAIDARSGRIDATLDVQGLAYPVLVDPSIAYPLWELVNTGVAQVPPRGSAPMVYDVKRGVSLMFGGSGFNDTWQWNGTVWTQIPTTNQPSGLGSPTMIYDPDRAITVLFGSGDQQNDTWEWDGTNWTQFTVVSPPPGREGHAFVYEAARKKTLMYGGYANGAYLGDTWEWDGTSWTQLHPTSSPGLRGWMGYAYDSVRGKTVIYGGRDLSTQYGFGYAVGYLGDTWEFDGTNWTQIQSSATTNPGVREYPVMTFDTVRQKTVLFGGFEPVNGSLGDTWSWDGTSWVAYAPVDTPVARTSGSFAFDSARGVIVLFGGDYLYTYTQGNNYIDDTWEWNGTDWTERAVAGSPSARRGSAMAFDTLRGRGVLFGGHVGNAVYDDYDDLWEWNGTTREWVERQSYSYGVGGPNSRELASMAYDEARQVTIIFGGYTRFYFNWGDTALWNGNSWTGYNTNLGSPSARQEAPMAYDASRSVTILFGGYDAYNLVFKGDTWAWGGSKWSLLSPANSPSARGGSAVAYDRGRGKIVIFGGRTGTSPNFIYLNETWEWDGTTWAKIPTTIQPSARVYSQMVYDTTRGKSVLFGGQDALGYDGDTWEWDGTTWTSPSLASPSPRQGPVMVFDPKHGAFLFGGLGTDPTTGATTYFDDSWSYVSVGAACTTNATCDSGYCTDGVCCAQALCGPCQTCAQPGQEGQCANVPQGTVPAGPVNACAAPKTCTADGTCGASLGASCTSASDCFTGFCVDGVCCNSACDGDCQACSVTRGLDQDGTCAFAPEGTNGRATCANDLKCNGKGPICPTGCTDDASCASGFYCSKDGTCQPAKSDGAACDDAAGADCLTAGCDECGAGHCVDGACCVSCVGTIVVGATCTNDAQCASNSCIGGICCSDSCAKTDAGSDPTCAQGVCGASTGYKCTYPSGTQCRTAGCTNGVQTFVAVCDGNGGCGLLQSKSCAPYACETGGISCRETCATNADCASDATCDVSSGTCVTTSACSSDGTSVIANNGTTTSCSPYVCASAKCVKMCASISDCASGFTCDPTGACVPMSAVPTTQPGGCSCRAAPRAPSWGGIALAAFVTTIAVRRRRRARRT